MSYELLRDLEGESEGDGQGRKPEIGNIFLMDRGGLKHGRQQAMGAAWAANLPGGAGEAVWRMWGAGGTVGLLWGAAGHRLSLQTLTM